MYIYDTFHSFYKTHFMEIVFQFSKFQFFHFIIIKFKPEAGTKSFWGNIKEIIKKLRGCIRKREMKQYIIDITEKSPRKEHIHM